jgi:HSP20 family protein
MHLMRWEPFREADEFFRSMASPMFGRWSSMTGENGGSRMEWAPAVDIKETDGEYLVLAELPGVKREEVKVSLEDSVLTVEGERKFEKEAKGERTHRIERHFGSFRRSFTLPEDADAGHIRAECKEGVLKVHVPKREAAKHKALQIKVD